jgi:hypothetical protein
MARYVVKFTLNGAPKTGLTPAVTAYFKLSDLADVAVPTIAEAKAGVYILTASPTEYMVVCIDGSATLTSASERYKTILIGPNDYFADASISSRGTGDATAANQTTIINGLTALLTAISGIPAAVWTYLDNFGNRIKANFVTFFQNADAATSNTVDNVTVIQEQQQGSRAVEFTIEDQDGPAPDVEVQILSISGNMVKMGRTNSSGIFLTSLDDGNYIPQCSKTWMTFPSEQITVDDSHAEFSITGESFSPTAPSSSDRQTVWDFAVNGRGLVQPGATISAAITDARSYNGGTVLRNRIEAIADANGRWELTLIKGVKYVVSVDYEGVNSEKKQIAIDTQPTRQFKTYPPA